MIAQAFQEVPKSHCIAVAFGLLPMLASWGLRLVDLALRKGGSSLVQAAPKFGDELPIYGLIALSQGALLISMIWTAAISHMLDRRFLRTAGWFLAGTALSFFGVIHAYRLSGNGVEAKLGVYVAPGFIFSYLASALFSIGCYFFIRRQGAPLEQTASALQRGGGPR